MSTKGILFKPYMARGIRKKYKTETRRPLNRLIGFGKASNVYLTEEGNDRYLNWVGPYNNDHCLNVLTALEFCPYGVVGNLFYVKEPYFAYGYKKSLPNNKFTFVDLTLEEGKSYKYLDDTLKKKSLALDEVGWHLRNSLFMPQVAARTYCRITNVNIEVLNDISDRSCMNEGISHIGKLCYDYEKKAYSLAPRESFYSLIKVIYGESYLESQPIVWAITFEFLENGTDEATQSV